MPVIVGVARSGTTLLRLMLDSHPELAIPPETGFVPYCGALRGRGSALRERFIERVTNYPHDAPNWVDFGIGVDELRETLPPSAEFTPTAGLRAFYAVYAHRHGKARWGDKTPDYLLQMPAIDRLLPEARFVHIIRDGRAVALSWRRTWFAPSRDIGTLARTWRRRIERGRRDSARVSHYLEVRFEQLVLEPETVLRQICEFCDLDFDARMLSYHERAEQRLTEHKARVRSDGAVLVTREARLGQQRLTVGPPDRTRIEAWREALTSRELLSFERAAGALRAELGYLP